MVIDDLAKHGAIAIALLTAFGTAWVMSLSSSNSHDESRLSGLDGLRGVLALAVIFAHFPLTWSLVAFGTWSPQVAGLSFLGSSAVTGFFMITAFLFYGKLRRSTMRAGSWFHLYLGRILRLTPMYLVTVLLMIITVLWQQGFARQVPYSELLISVAKWATFTITSPANINGFNNTWYMTAGVIWTLRYEWVFYATLPALAVLLGMVGNRPTILALLSLAIGLVLMISPTVSVHDYDSHRLAPFFLGMFGYDISTLPRLRQVLKGQTGTMSVAIGSVALCIARDSEYDLTTSLLSLAIFLPIVSGNELLGFLSSKSVRTIGDASYSIYLLHGLILFWLFYAYRTFGGPLDIVAPWALLPVATIVSIVFSTISYRMIERPFILAGRRSPGQPRERRGSFQRR
jgi:peptidoglycan/LPS O-acetylase OafA/YrhL